MKNDTKNMEYEGVWKISSTIQCENNGDEDITNIIMFKYENDHVTLNLPSLHKTYWQSEDEFYTLKLKWRKNNLYYLPPIGIWTKLAVFEDHRFVNISGGIKRIFERIAEDKIVGWSRAILNPRSPYQYSSEASGSKNS